MNAGAMDWQLSRIGDRASTVPAFLLRGADEKPDVRADLLDRRNIHLTRTQTGRTLLVLDQVAMLLALSTEVDGFRVLIPNTANHLAVLAEEESAVGVQHDPCVWNGHGATRW